MFKLRIQLFAEEETPIDKNYLEEITNLKKQMETMVAGEEYEKVLAEHKRLTNEFINKRTPVVEAKPVERDIKEIIADLRKESNNKLDHVKLSLEYRDRYKKQFGKDPWVGGSVTDVDADSIAQGYQSLVEEYGDDPSEFTFRFDEALRDDPSVVQALRAKRVSQK